MTTRKTGKPEKRASSYTVNLQTGKVNEMEWSEGTTCKVCGWTLAHKHNMCPNRDNVCQFCCLWCIDAFWGCDPVCQFSGTRESIADTQDSNYQKDFDYGENRLQRRDEPTSNEES